MLFSFSFILFSAVASAQSVIDYSKLPACAKSCSVLQQAEGGCVPPAALVSNQATYQSCFCQSAFLTSLKTSPSLCEPACSADDATAIESYYVSLCNGPVVEPATTTQTTATTTATTAATTTTTGTNTATGTAVAGNKGVSDANSSNNSWFSHHWKWVLMLIVIFLAMIIIWPAAIFFKRRHNRKRDLQRGNLAAPDAFIVDHPLPQNTAHTSNTLSKEIGMPSPMAMSGGRGGMGMDSGIAPPRAARVRSRSNTLTSMGHGSHGNVPQPVVWGPHQNQAHGSPLNSVPPSPTLNSPSPVFMNERARGSETRFANYHAAGMGKKGLNVEAAQVPSAGLLSPSPVSPIEEGPPRMGSPGFGGGGPVSAQMIREMRSKENVGRSGLGRGGVGVVDGDLGAGESGAGGMGMGRVLSKKLNKKASRSSRNE
ncbi:hypothetical protein K432DRAFT_404336 [Lepidopterella palustris CBS 459.81]|uniref:CFEM domain-containing protein n=1 Tax=Lepidopterella palustris CBS 459.81 TaxID=1314670 RepID=A0A8E2EBC9_9PEZI|nr:hypothetical protein K432DRAFT_404336 [Lepidopterella palustris CBS 459.81]